MDDTGTSVGEVYELAVGMAYRPYGLFNGAIVPYSLLQCRDLSPGAKLLFGELAALQGKDRFCRPSLAHLANRVGASEDQVTRWLRELKSYGLIVGRRGGPGSYTERVFIWNPILEESLKKGVRVHSPLASPRVTVSGTPIDYVITRNEGSSETADPRCGKTKKCGALNTEERGAPNKEEEVGKSRGSAEEKLSPNDCLRTSVNTSSITSEARTSHPCGLPKEAEIWNEVVTAGIPVDLWDWSMREGKDLRRCRLHRHFTTEAWRQVCTKTQAILDAGHPKAAFLKSFHWLIKADENWWRVLDRGYDSLLEKEIPASARKEKSWLDKYK